MKAFLETVKKYNLIKQHDRILVGVSGGADSLTLLLQLVKLKKPLGIDLHIAHLDHGMRKDSQADTLFVKKWAEKLNIPVTIKRLNPKLIKSKGSLEEILREARFAFLINTAKKIKAQKVALGHNLNDQAETVLMRLLRGAGLSGLSGIAKSRVINNVVFIRPLLGTSRRQIEDFLKRRKIKSLQDPTNREELFLRNKIRHYLIPLLRKNYNPNIIEILANLAENVADDYDYLNQSTKKYVKGKKLFLKLKQLLKFHPAILRLTLRNTIALIQGDTRRINFQHIRELEELLKFRPEKSIVDLPKGVSVQKTRTALHFFKR